MHDPANLKENIDDVNINFEKEMEMKKLREEVIKRFADYRNTINFMAADAPIAILCLPAAIEKILLNEGCLRVYDLFNLDFVKIKGLGEGRVRDLTSRLDQFLSML